MEIAFQWAYESLNPEELQQALEVATEEMFDAMDRLEAFRITRAAIMNVIQGKQNEQVY